MTFGFVARRLMVKCLSRGRSWWVEFGILKGSRIGKNLEKVLRECKEDDCLTDR